jgi:hypothetical protein
LLRALNDVAMVDEALAAQAAAVGAALLAMQWSRKPGAPEEVVQAADWLLERLRPFDDVSTGVAGAWALEASSSSCMEPPAGECGGQTACAACGAASTADGKALKMCSACRGVSYCSGACQKRDWSKHRVACRRAG